MVKSLELTLQPPSWEDPWGPYYFKKGSYGELKIYNDDKELLTSTAWPDFGYMVSDTSLKRALVLRKSNVAALTKLKLLEKELEGFTTDFRLLYEHNLIVEQQAEAWKWAVVGESGVVGILLLLLVLL